MSAASPAARSAPAARWLRPFARVTSNGRFVPEIDGLRAVAIGAVLFFHLAFDLQAKAPGWTIPTSGILATPCRFGFRGVELFFVISGFVLGMPFAARHFQRKPPPPLGDYFLRRVTRLEPPYIVAMLASFAALILFHGRSAGELWPHLGAGLVYQHSLLFVAENPISNVAWSLEVEIQFYLLVPLLSQLFAIRSPAVRRAVLAALILGLAVATSLLWLPDTRPWFSILRFLHFFLAGFLLADLFLLEWSVRPSHTKKWDVLVLVGAPALLWIFDRFGAPGPQGEPLIPLLAMTVAAPLFCAAVFRGDWVNRALTNPWVTAFGGMCYSIYLLHNQILGVILSRTQSWHPTASWGSDLLLQAIVTFPLIMVPIAVFFLLVEKPCMQRDWPQRLMARLGFAKREGAA